MQDAQRLDAVLENDAAQVEITALAAGAGPPANNTATRRNSDVTLGGADMESGIGSSLLLGFSPFGDFRCEPCSGQWDAVGACQIA